MADGAYNCALFLHIIGQFYWITWGESIGLKDFKLLKKKKIIPEAFREAAKKFFSKWPEGGGAKHVCT